MKITFCENEYVRSHGTYPKGRGTWLFDINGEWYEAGCWKTLTEAKKEVREYIKQTRPNASVVVAHILP